MKYKREKDQLPADADGIYFIVSGNARIVNSYDQYDFNNTKLGPGEYFGISKFILAQGYSFFGDIIALKPEAPKEESKQQSSNKKQVNTQQSIISSNQSAARR